MQVCTFWGEATVALSLQLTSTNEYGEGRGGEGRGWVEGSGADNLLRTTASHPERVTIPCRFMPQKLSQLNVGFRGLVQAYSVGTLSMTSMVLVMRFGFLFLTETAINIGYSCHLLTDDMTEVFIINGETLESVQQAIAEYKNKILPGGASTPKAQKENSLRDVDVEVLSYKARNDDLEIPISTQVITTSVCTYRQL